jgi:hypothetical protein
VVRKKQTKPLAELMREPPHLRILQQPEFTIQKLLEELLEKTGASYEDLGAVLNLSHVQIGRVVRGEKGYLQEDQLARLISSFNLPFRRVVYANAIARFEHEQLALARHSPSDEDVAVGPDEIAVYAYVRLPIHTWNTNESIEHRLSIIRKNTASEIVRMGNMVPMRAQDTIFVRHSGTHMQAENVLQHIIPDRAVIEVQIVPTEEIRNGDIVFVQLRDEFATSYIYRRDVHKDGEYEEFRPINNQYPMRIVHWRRGIDPYLHEQRIIYGRVNRIVDYRLT